MTKLNDIQLVILSAASQRKDGAVILPETLTGKAAEKVVSALARKQLIEVVPSRRKLPVWRKSEDGQRLSLKITDKGLAALGMDVSQADAGDEDAMPPARAEEQLKPHADASKARPLGAPRPGSKQALLVDALLRPEGATLEALRSATGWLPHTVRAALTGLRKRGYTVAAQRVEGVSTYRASAPGLVAIEDTTAGAE